VESVIDDVEEEEEVKPKSDDEKLEALV